MRSWIAFLRPLPSFVEHIPELGTLIPVKQNNLSSTTQTLARAIQGRDLRPGLLEYEDYQQQKRQLVTPHYKSRGLHTLLNSSKQSQQSVKNGQRMRRAAGDV